MNLEQLLTHADFVKALARRLVGDEHRARDIAQQTWLAALKHPPAEGKPVRAWLTTVAHNFSRMAHRSETRRLKHETATTEERPYATPEEIAAREEARRHMMEAVLALAEPYRTVILRRYYDDLSPKIIAEQLDLPLETIRTRLKRGLEQLRGRLDHTYGGDRGAWMAAIVPLAGIDLAAPTAAGSATGLLGFLAYLAPLKAAILVVAILSVVLVALPFVETRNPEQAAELAADEPPPEPRPFSGAAKAQVVLETAEAQKEPVPSLEGRVVNGLVIHRDTMEPLAGLRVKAREKYNIYAHWSQTPSAETGPDGRFSIQGVPWSQCWLDIDHPEFGGQISLTVDPSTASHEYFLEAYPAVSLAVRVVDEEGRPEPYAWLTLYWYSDGVAYSDMVYRCDAKGEYLFGGLGLNAQVTLLAQGDQEMESSEVVRMETIPGAANEITLVVRPGNTVIAWLRDDKGKAIANARVRLNSTYQTERGAYHFPFPQNFIDAAEPYYSDRFGVVRSDQEGRIVLGNLPAGDYQIQSAATGYWGGEMNFLVTKSGITLPEKVRLVLNRATCCVQVVDEAGESLPEAYAYFFVKFPGRAQEHMYCYTLDGEARTNAPEIPADARLRGAIVLKGYASTILDKITFDQKELRVSMTRGASVSGRVISARDGRPVSRFTLQRFQWEKGQRYQHFEKAMVSGDEKHWQLECQDPEGRFTFPGLTPRLHKMKVTAPGYLTQWIEAEVTQTDQAVKDLVIKLEPALSVYGRVLKSSGEPLVRAEVRVINTSQQASSSGWTDLQGRFRADGLMPGDVWFSVEAEQNDNGAPGDPEKEKSWTLDGFYLDEAKAEEEILLTVHVETGCLRIRVLDQQGQPVQKARVECAAVVRAIDSSPKRERETNDDGWACFDEISTASCTVKVQAQSSNTFWTKKLLVDVLDAGETRLEVRQPDPTTVRQLVGRVLCDGKGVANVTVSLKTYSIGHRDPDPIDSVVKTDDQGLFSCQGIAPGKYLLKTDYEAEVMIQVSAEITTFTQDIEIGGQGLKGTLTRNGRTLLPGSFQGRVFLASLKPGEQQGKFYRHLSVDKDGSFAFAHLFEGTYLLYAVAEVEKELYAALQVLEVNGNGAKARPVTLELAEPGYLEVARPTRSEIVDVKLYLLFNDLEIELPFMFVDITFAGPLYRFQGLLPGSYRLVYHGYEGKKKSQFIDIAAWQVMELEAH